MLNIGVDVGGTFTDFVVFDEETGEIRVGKVATTPQDPTLAFMEGLRQMKIDLGKARRIVHGTTIATNAVVERKGAKTAFMTTRGHRDVIEFGQLRRYVEGELWDTHWECPPAYVHCIGISILSGQRLEISKSSSSLTPNPYLALYFGTKEQSFSHSQVRLLVWSYGLIYLLAILVAIPYWRWLGMPP